MRLTFTGVSPSQSTSSRILPTPSIPEFGGLITGVNASTPYIPSAVTEKVPPSISASDSFLFLAASASRLVSIAISASSSWSVPCTTGTTNPSGTATAIPTLIWFSSTMSLPSIWLFAAGCWMRACAAAAITKSV